MWSSTTFWRACKGAGAVLLRTYSTQKGLEECPCGPAQHVQSPGGVQTTKQQSRSAPLRCIRRCSPTWYLSDRVYGSFTFCRGYLDPSSAVPRPRVHRSSRSHSALDRWYVSSHRRLLVGLSAHLSQQGYNRSDALAFAIQVRPLWNFYDSLSQGFA